MSDNYLLYDPAAFGALEIKEDTRDAEILRLRAENEKLRAALRPFAEICERCQLAFNDIEDGDELMFATTDFVHLHAAAAALKE